MPVESNKSTNIIETKSLPSQTLNKRSVESFEENMFAIWLFTFLHDNLQKIIGVSLCTVKWIKAVETIRCVEISFDETTT